MREECLAVGGHVQTYWFNSSFDFVRFLHIIHLYSSQATMSSIEHSPIRLALRLVCAFLLTHLKCQKWRVANNIITYHIKEERRKKTYTQISRDIHTILRYRELFYQIDGFVVRSWRVIFCMCVRLFNVHFVEDYIYAKWGKTRYIMYAFTYRVEFRKTSRFDYFDECLFLY